MCLSLVCGLGVGLSSAAADDWPQWLGPNRDGQWKEAGVLDTLGKELKLLWAAKIGHGYSGPAVAQGKVILMDRVTDAPTAEGGQLTTSKGKERVVCLNADKGTEVWVHEYDCEYKNISYSSGPRTTPVFDGDRVYTLGTMGDLTCLATKDGKPVRATSFPKDHKAPTPAWGWSAHLLLEGNVVIALVGGEKQAVMAFDKNVNATRNGRCINGHFRMGSGLANPVGRRPEDLECVRTWNNRFPLGSVHGASVSLVVARHLRDDVEFLVIEPA